jgi:hypothetical protein
VLAAETGAVRAKNRTKLQGQKRCVVGMATELCDAGEVSIGMKASPRRCGLHFVCRANEP